MNATSKQTIGPNNVKGTNQPSTNSCSSNQEINAQNEPKMMKGHSVCRSGHKTLASKANTQ